MTPQPDDPTGPIRAAIRRIADQREQARADAGRALVTQEQVRAALRDQRRRLAEAQEDITAAIRTAGQAAAGARADALTDARRDGRPEDQAALLADAAAQPYEHAQRGLTDQLAVIAESAAQLADLTGAAARQIADSRALVQASLHAMDTALREQLTLLVQLERAERTRLVERARRRG